MRYMRLDEFVENLEEVIDAAVLNEEMTNIELEDGENLVLMTERQYECFIEAMARKERGM